MIARAQADLLRLNATGQTVGSGLGGPLASGARQASGSFLSLQQAAARLEVSEGNLAGAAARLRAALATQTTTTTQVINARRQLIAVEKQLETGQSSLARAFSEAGAAGKSSLAGMIGPAALATAGIGALVSAVRSFADAVAFKAELDATTASINAQLKGVRDSGAAMAEAAAFGREYKLTQQEQTEAIAASVGVMRQSKASVEDILSVMARLQILSPEQSLQEAAIAMKALAGGDSLSLQTRFEVGRDEAALMKEEIRGGADAVEVLGRHLDSIGIGMDALKAKTTGVAGAIKDVAIAQEEFTLAQAKFAQGPGLAILQTQTTTLSGLTRILSGDFAAMGQSIQQGAAQGNNAFSALTAMMGQSADAWAVVAQQALYHQSVLQGVSGATLAVAAAQQAQAAAGVQAGGASIYQSQAMIDATAAAQANAAAMAEQLQKTLDAKINSEQLAVIQATLARIGAAVAGGHITAANGAAQLANMYGIATGEAYKLVQAQAALAGIQASGAATAADGVAQHTLRLQAQGAAYQKIRDAQEQQTIQIGTAAQRQAVLNAQLERARVTYGQQSVEFIRADTALKQFQASQAKTPKGGGAGGGGVKLSDQTRLNNQLLAGQESYQNKAEDAEAEHARRLIDIAADAAEKRAEAMNAFNQDALDSRASFYLSLADVENAGLQRAMSERFEAIQQEAGRIEQQSGADAALAFENAATKALQDQARIQEAITKAQEGGDGGKAEFLTGVLAAQVKADEARLERIKASGSAIATEEARQQADEIARFEEASGKITTAAERATLAKITAAQRGGKEVDAEALKVDNLVASYERLGRVAPRTPVAGAPAPAQASPAAPGAAAGAAPAPIDLGAVVTALQDVGGKVTAAKEAIERAVRDGSSQVAGAVSSRTFS